jgi:TonB family protein
MRGFTIIVATILSTVIHFFIFTLLGTIPLISKEISPQPDFYMVDLVPLAVERPAPQKEEEPAVQQKVEEVKREEIKQEEVKKEEVTREEVKKEEVKKEEVKEVEKKEEVKKEDKAVVADAGTEQENKEKTEKLAPNPEEQLSATIEALKRKYPAPEQGDSRTPEVTAAEIEQYKDMVSEKVKGFWVILNIWSEEELEVKVVIEVDERGQVNPRFDEFSGNPNFDDAVRRAINRAAPFPPPPGKEPINIPRSFKSSSLR